MQFYVFFGLHSLGIGKRVCYQELLKPLNMFMDIHCIIGLSRILFD